MIEPANLRKEPYAQLSKTVLLRAKKLGFTPPRIADLADFGDGPAAALQAYLAKGHHGTMTWMAQTQARRQGQRRRPNRSEAFSSVFLI